MRKSTRRFWVVLAGGQLSIRTDQNLSCTGTPEER